ncbi:hypothetical protein E2493_07605 [Sphingomonas parva]|uniref:Uncharacterized protein n=1 Tax=Sphingomonas parva TaxID=2555898 RepID=A0A4Y8ZS99_9SPHN|nr:hypothetical protein [Sphingomonas parva]TFI58918.1 hypothetical protein E2493_07605 [Sphingomonas parva]
MAWNRNRTILGVAAAAAAGLGYYAVQLVRGRGGLAAVLGRNARSSGAGITGSAALAGDGAEGAVGNSGAARDAGAAEMRDPPQRWTAQDEAVDETFPASDPVTAKHVD